MKRREVNVVMKRLLITAIMHDANAWYEVIRWKGMREKLIRCQRVIMLYGCLRVCRTVSTEAMQIFFVSFPWDLECVRKTNSLQGGKRPLYERFRFGDG